MRKGLTDKAACDAPFLISGQNAHGAEGENFYLMAVIANDAGFLKRDGRHNQSPCLRNEVKFRHKARRRAHALEDEVLGGARRIAVPKRLPQNSFGCGVIGRGCTADGDVGGKESF